MLHLHPFRGCPAAAPLKRDPDALSEPLRGALPRLSSRGPIEADILLSFLVDGGSLPRLSSRGPIEAGMTGSHSTH